MVHKYTCKNIKRNIWEETGSQSNYNLSRSFSLCVWNIIDGPTGLVTRNFFLCTGAPYNNNNRLGPVDIGGDKRNRAECERIFRPSAHLLETVFSIAF